MTEIKKNFKFERTVLTLIAHTLALYLSLFMAIFLFSFAYIEGIKIANTEGKVYGGTFIFTVMMAFVFSNLAYTFK
ncbi:hypothetical protein K6959_13580 [Bacillus aquiflavi]|uniref:hypothetical protein n=1 Tax=Bacillus aquiflavi TaxID=2672567 RepID=UPI001CA9A2EC|nr:hypothetical protein [Bacillus aquiflavi]UAC47655.1 hypothetical protein K6959_13580 [Bacillus aquiflavi]